MAGTKLTDLASVAVLTAPDTMYIVQGGVSKKTTIQAFANGAADFAPVNLRTENLAYLVAAGDEIVRCNGTFTVTLPPATGSRAIYVIKNINTGVITIDANLAETIDGQLTYTLYSYERVVLVDAAVGVWDAY